MSSRGRKEVARRWRGKMGGGMGMGDCGDDGGRGLAMAACLSFNGSKGFYGQ